MGRRAGLCLLAVLFYLQASAISALVSHSLFRLADVTKHEIGGSYVEAYWQILPGSIHYTNQDGQWRASILTDVVFKSDTGVVAEQHFNLRTPPRASLGEAQQQNITDLRRFMLPAGKIIMQVTLAEAIDPKGKFTYTDSFTVDNNKGIFYSTPQLLDTSYVSSAQNIFSKNGRQHVPLCANFLDNYRSTLHYYTELYQATPLAESDYPLVQKIFISKRELESPVYGLIQKDSIGKGMILPEYGDFPIGVLASGNYYLNTVLEDRTGLRIASGSFFFQRENKKPEQVVTERKRDSAMEQVVVVDIAKTFVTKFTLPQVMAVLKMISPISSALEIQTIKGFQKKPDDMYMRYFIYNFWTGRNKKDPEGEWKKYAARILEVNKMFSAGALKGYETDRGVIYLKYGPPDERVPVENEAGALPYEIWEYRALGKQNQEGVFLFYRPPEMVSDYRLLHSTVLGETRNQSWRNYLYLSNTSGANNTNSRAEQYIRNR